MWRHLCVLIYLLALVGCQRVQPLDITPGSPVPAFTLKNLEGQPVSLASFKGKTVLLNFWAPWCGPCIEEMPSLEALHKSFGAKGLTIVAVAVEDDLEAIRAFQEKTHLTFVILQDTGRVVSSAYKVQGFPETFIVDKDGRAVLFPDPEDRSDSVRIIGPRSWDSSAIKSRLEALL